MLCKACTQIFEGQLELGSVRHHSTASDLRETCQTGCQLCQLLWPFFLENSGSEDISQEYTSLVYGVQRGKDSTVFGYANIPSELYLLMFSLNVEVDKPTKVSEKYKLFIVEPFQGQ